MRLWQRSDARHKSKQFRGTHEFHSCWASWCTAFAISLVLLVMPGIARAAAAQADPYPAMAPLEEYLMPEEAEIAMARSAAPASIADGATVMVLGRQGYRTAAEGRTALCAMWSGPGPGRRMIRSSGIRNYMPPIALMRQRPGALRRSI